MINNDHKLNRILESTILDKYGLINLSMEQHDDSSQEVNTGIGKAPTLDTRSTSGLTPREGSSVELC